MSVCRKRKYIEELSTLNGMARGRGGMKIGVRSPFYPDPGGIQEGKGAGQRAQLPREARFHLRGCSG
ncbi:MAG: hypothetical protein U5Q44_13865 [Dehalococcoidia bacterium]|nr:hypothetical protein [Dehalococcoidia bacterium]